MKKPTRERGQFLGTYFLQVGLKIMNEKTDLSKREKRLYELRMLIVGYMQIENISKAREHFELWQAELELEKDKQVAQ
ncbi:hypothetical protein [Bergeriella denitrificans]|nr:hypothetical protein [Bergeriella denitrificans]